MSTEYEPVIGLEVHAELQTRSKMFCACPVVDSTQAEPNTAVCPVCAGMPGVLPVVNRRVVEYGLRVALALHCEIAPFSLFARKNYFYPDLPKGYQISQYEQPLAHNGHVVIYTSQGERIIRIRRVHLEEDTGKLTHIERNGEAYSLIDLNRAGVPLLEVVTEPDLTNAEEVRAYAVALRSILCYLGVNSGDMQKGVLRIEPNISIRPLGSSELGTKVEIKNLNSFRALERSVAFEIDRQSELLSQGKAVIQETRGWDEILGQTVSQRVKEEAHDYRYFTEPDLPPLVIEPEWIDTIKASLPELPAARLQRFREQYKLIAYDAGILIEEQGTSDYYEQVILAKPELPPKVVANWIIGELFGLLNQKGLGLSESPVKPAGLAGLLHLLVRGEINQSIAKTVLGEMFATGQTADEIVARRGLRQISDIAQIGEMVAQVLASHPDQVAAYLGGKEAISMWLFGQVMSAAKGRANPKIIQEELQRQLKDLKNS